MIKNIVFDLGNVLVDFDTYSYLASFGLDDEKIRILSRMIYEKDWALYDRGDYKTIHDLRSSIVKTYPDYEKELSMILVPEWVNMHTLKNETAEYLLELKSRGFGIYILSNLPTEAYDRVIGFDFMKKIDGGVFSYQEGTIKPEERIYRILLERYDLVPGECVFLDDMERNIETARKIGMNGIVFRDIDSAENELESLLAKENSQLIGRD